MPLIEVIMKPTLVASVGVVGDLIMSGMGSTLNILGKELPSSIVVGGVLLGTSVLADIAHQYILPVIPGNSKFSTFESMLLSPAANGAALTAVSAMSVGGAAPLKFFLYGAGAEIAGQYLYETYPSMQGTKL